VPELPAGYRPPLPGVRPAGLRRRRLNAGTGLRRVEADAATEWARAGFTDPRFRFDPASGAFRTRYAATTPAGAFRERYRATGLVIPADHAGHHLVRLVAAAHLRVLDLRTQANLDALDVDDQISTGQHADVRATCHRLADAARRWWPDLDGIMYRSRTTPEESVNVAFFGTCGLTARSWPLTGRDDVLVDLVLRHDFTLGWDIGSAGKLPQRR
jgi:hypothetical protein